MDLPLGMHGGRASGGLRVPKGFCASLEPSRREARENAAFGRGEGKPPVLVSAVPSGTHLLQWDDRPGHSFGRFHLPQESLDSCWTEWLSCRASLV